MSDLLEKARAARRLPSPAVAALIRREAGVSQADVAEALGVHPVTVARWELGTRRPRGELRVAYVELLDQLQDAAP